MTLQDSRERLEVRVSLQKVCDAVEPSHEVAFEAQEMMERYGNMAVDSNGSLVRVTAKFFLKFVGAGVLDDVTVNITPPNFVFLPSKSFMVKGLKGGAATPLIQPVTMYVLRGVLASSLVGTVTAL